MQIANIFLLAGTFAVVFGLSCVAMLALRPRKQQKRIDQIRRESSDARTDTGEKLWLRRLRLIAKPLAAFSAPKGGQEDSDLRTRFTHAGWRQPDAIALYFAIKTILLLGLPLLVSIALAGRFDAEHQLQYVAILSGAAGIGFYLPNVVLRWKIHHRQREIFEAFPDSLDLIMVCVEAGLGLDAAIMRVVEEMHLTHPELASEYELLTLELRAGLPRDKAMRNLAARTGVEDVAMLVAMLIQADRFGTSMADSLRVHSDVLRAKRHMLAEERAAKIGTKILFPMMFCIFPTLFIVLLGPAALQILAAMKLGGN